MDAIQTWVLALIQGLTEFLPISSSAHLILAPVLLGWPDQGLSFDVAVHLGTLAAVMAYFRREVARMTLAWFGSLRPGGLTADGRLAWAVLWATIPVGVAGVLGADFIEAELRSPLVIAAATVGFGVLLGWADRRGRGERDEYALTWRDVLIISLAQATALIPGTSRSGVTITAALAMGLNRSAAARFSFLLSIPVIVLAGGYEGATLLADPGQIEPLVLLYGALISGVFAYLTIHFFLQLVERVGMMPFVIYRLALGTALFWVFA